MSIRSYLSFNGYPILRLIIISLPAISTKVIWNGTFALCYILQENIAPIALVGYTLTVMVLAILFIQCLKLIPNFKLIGLGIFCTIFYVLYTIPAFDFDRVALRFSLHEQQYFTQIEADKSLSPKFIVIPWGELALFPAGGVWENLIYDEADQVGLAPEKRSPEWTDRHGGYATKMLPQCEFTILSLGEHFFYTHEFC
jgi:hypothetical protein